MIMLNIIKYVLQKLCSSMSITCLYLEWDIVENTKIIHSKF